MKKSSYTAREEDERYRSIFEHSAVSLWEEDITRLRARIYELKRNVRSSLRDYLSDHPESVQDAHGLIEVIDVNQATLHLFEADGKEQLLGPLNAVLGQMPEEALLGIMLAIDEGIPDIETEASVFTLKEKKLIVIMKTFIPLLGTAFTPMIVSVIDMTARREAEERERQSAIILHSIVESTPDSIFVKDASLRMVLCNSALAHAIGKEPDETIGKSDVENGWSADLVNGKRMISRSSRGKRSGWRRNRLTSRAASAISTR